MKGPGEPDCLGSCPPGLRDLRKPSRPPPGEQEVQLCHLLAMCPPCTSNPCLRGVKDGVPESGRKPGYCFITCLYLRAVEGTSPLLLSPLHPEGPT